MENINALTDNVKDKLANVKDNIVNAAENVKEGFENIKPETPKQFSISETSKEFLSSNTLVAKAAFLLLVIILFVFLFALFSKVLIYFMSPSPSPFIIDGMKDGKTAMTVTQDLGRNKSIPLLRSINEYDGVEFTYSCWLYVDDIVYKEDTDFKHVFHKGSLKDGDRIGIFGPNNCPGVYLYQGKRAITYDNNLDEKYPLLGMLVRINVFHDNEDSDNPYKYYDDIYVDGIPIKKWVCVIIRVTSQNVADIYINGTLTKRHKLSNIVKQNYDNLHVSMNGGFDGNISNLRYYNYAIGTYEVEKIVSNGPNLEMRKNDNIRKSAPSYLSPQWYHNDTDPLT